MHTHNHRGLGLVVAHDFHTVISATVNFGRLDLRITRTRGTICRYFLNSDPSAGRYSGTGGCRGQTAKLTSAWLSLLLSL